MFSDLDVCKKIAEIEGLEVIHSKTFDIQRIAVKKNYYSGKEYASKARNIAIESEYFKHNTYNPLTDDALCFQLMVKYKVKVIYETGPDYYHAFVTCPLNKIGYSDENPNRAICLAIIEAHKS